MDQEIINQILTTLDKIRPFINKDGGDIEFVKFEEGIVYIKMHGACADCAFVDETISNGIELILQEEVPGIIGVKVVEDNSLPPRPDIEFVMEDEKK